MPKVFFSNKNKQVDVGKETKLLDAARKAGVTIKTRCQGNAACLMCKVIVQDLNGLSEPAEKEIRKLGDWIDKGYRLSCQAKVHRDTSVLIPEDPLKSVVQARLRELKNQAKEEK